MTFTPPDIDELKALGAEFGMMLSDDYAGRMAAFIPLFAQGYEALDGLPESQPTAHAFDRQWQPPDAAMNPFGAWLARCSIKGRPGGPLEGRAVAIKDTVSVAGLPLTCGSEVLSDFIADIDATVITRLLDAGAEIAGKAVCEYFCTSGGSCTSATGPVRNPHNPAFSTGGSSSGCAALVASGAVDMAVGGDQGGSVRIPASWSGICGMKPTHGLVPYTGIMGMEASIDHAGPMTATVADNALMLEVLAGADGIDSRQCAPIVKPYTEALGHSAEGLRIGLVSEGFGQPFAESDVDDCVRQAATAFASLGASVGEVSVPMHGLGQAIWSPIAVEGFHNTMMLGGFGYNAGGLAMTSLHDALRDWRQHGGALPHPVLFLLVLGRYAVKRYAGGYYARAQNARRALAAAYDRALIDYDLLVMPTTPMKAAPLPDPEASFEDVMLHCLTNVGNCCPFDVSGHPAMSIPCGLRDGLPVGMMLVAGKFAEPTIYRAAHAFEQAIDWRAAAA